MKQLKYRALLVLTACLIQGLWAAPSSSSDLDKPASPGASPGASPEVSPEASRIQTTPSTDADLSQEFQRLKKDAERFKEQVLQFTSTISAQLKAGSSLREVIKKVAEVVTTQIVAYVKQVEEGANAFLIRAGQITNEKGKEALKSTLATAETTIEALRSRSEKMFQNGIAYLQAIERIVVGQPDPESQVPAQAQPYVEYIERNLMHKLKGNAQLSDVSKQGGPDTQKTSELTEGANQHLQRRDPAAPGAPGGTGADGTSGGITSAVAQQYKDVRDSGLNLIKGVASLSTGGIIGILDGLSAILSTTSEVSQQAKRALSEINKSGTHAVTSVIGTAGSYVSGTLERTGSAVESLRMPGSGSSAAQGGSSDSTTSAASAVKT